MVAGSREAFLERVQKRELIGKLRRLIFKEEPSWIEWEEGLVLAYTPGKLNEWVRGIGYERLCLSCAKGSEQERPEKGNGKRVMLLLGLVLLDEERCYSDLVVYEDRVDEMPCLVVEWREWVQGCCWSSGAETAVARGVGGH